MIDTKSRWSSLAQTFVSFCLAIGLASASSAASSQMVAAPAARADAAGAAAGSAAAHAEGSPAGVRNGFGETLRPSVRRTSARLGQPYAPIKKQDETGQIPEIEMFVGESRVFPAPNVGRIAVGNGQIMTAAALDKKEVIVFANAAGTSSLFVWNEDGRYQRIKINIVAGDTSRIAREIAAFLAAIPHAKASIVGDKVIVEGDNLNDADMAKIDQLEKRYPQLVNFTNRVGWEQMVMMDVKVVEFPKSELKEIGLKWGAVGGTTIAATWLPIRSGTPPAGTQYTVNIPAPQSGLPVTSVNNSGGGIPLPSSLNLLGALNLGLSAQLNLLEQEGRASVLAEPQLSARNGAKASFLAGGEFPYSVSNVNGVTIIFKPYGIKLDISPKVDRNGVIRATIQAEVSSIDASVSTLAGPALLTRRTDTEFNVRSGDTMVLAGLLQRNASSDIDKVPVLGDLPVLGALFRSKRFQNKETELVIFVTPTVVTSQSPGLVDRVQRTTDRLQQRMGPRPYLSDPLQPGLPAADFNQTPPDARPANSPMAPPPVPPAPSADLGKSDGPASTGGSMLEVIASSAHLRADPNAASPTVLQLSRGAVVRLANRAAQPPGLNTWQPVLVGAVEGWIATTEVAPLRLAMPADADRGNEAARAALQGGMAGERIAAPVGVPVPVTAAGSGQESTSAPTSASAYSAAKVRFRVLLDGLALRVSPDVNAQLVMKLESGAVVEALPEQNQGYWTAVQAGDKRGWAATQWLIPQAALLAK